MSLKEKCIASLNEALADVKPDKKGTKHGTLAKVSTDDASDPNNLMEVQLDTKKNQVVIMSPPPVANCVQVSLDTHEDHWSWKALHAALFD